MRFHNEPKKKKKKSTNTDALARGFGRFFFRSHDYLPKQFLHAYIKTQNDPGDCCSKGGGR